MVSETLLKMNDTVRSEFICKMEKDESMFWISEEKPTYILYLVRHKVRSLNTYTLFVCIVKYTFIGFI